MTKNNNKTKKNIDLLLCMSCGETSAKYLYI